MRNTLKRTYPFFTDLKFNLKTIVSISLGVFLFLLFFQPFQIQNPDFNKKLLILVTFGTITLVLLGMFRLFLPFLFPKAFSENNWTLLREVITSFIFAVLNSVAFVFFAKYVGRIPITFHIVIMIVIISLCVVTALILITEYHYLRNQLRKYDTIFPMEESETETDENAEIEFESENKSEYFQLSLQQIILIKSANNYIEVIYKQENKTHKKLIRNTLKNTEKQFAKYPSMLRCHRSYIVNKNYIQKVKKGSNSLILVLFDYPQEIHVSRQYILVVKEALKAT